MSQFEASVQYNDFKGTAAADRSDNLSLQKYLVSEGLATEAQRVVGLRIGFAGNHGQEVNQPGVVIYLCEGGFDEPFGVIHAIDVPMTTEKLFSFFKRFSIVLTEKGKQFEGVPVEGPDYG